MSRGAKNKIDGADFSFVVSATESAGRLGCSLGDKFAHR